jgi:hypothetical protein
MSPLSSRDFKQLRILNLLITAAALTLAATLTGRAVESRGAGDEKPAAAESDARKIEREENRKGMEQRARATKVRVSAQPEDGAAQFIAKPLFHYTDQPRRIVDAMLWGWLAKGRLVAVCKIEKYDHPQPENRWLYCFGSLAPELIDAEWQDLNRRWSATKPGIELQSIADAPAAAEGQAARLRQIKEIAGRFQAVITTDPTIDAKQEMRLLPHPVYRYEKPVGEILDGAVFGMTTNGTNPDAILIVELHRQEGSPPAWKFAVAGMTSGGLSVKVGDREVWSRPSVPSTGSYDTWLFFFGK